MIRDDNKMKYKDLFTRLYYLDDTSPTGIRKAWNNQPAGMKQKHENGYMWVIKDWFQFEDGSKKQITYDLAACLYEMRTGQELQKDQMIIYLDGNKDNLLPYNVTVGKQDRYKQKRYKQQAYDNFRNVVLPKTNPDYFKDPKDWTHPKALELLQAERDKRATGQCKPIPMTLGRRVNLM